MDPDGTLPKENGKVEGNISRTSSPSPEQKRRDAKATAILEACKWRDIETLRTFATSEGGLVSDDVRRQACSCHPERSCESTLTSIPGLLLLGCSSHDSDIKPENDDSSSWTNLAKHRDEDQVQLDVDRSFIYYPSGTPLTQSHIT